MHTSSFLAACGRDGRAKSTSSTAGRFAAITVEEPSSHVTLEGVPAALFIASQNHQHDLLRELALLDLGSRWSLAEREVPERVAAFLGEILADYAGVRTATRGQALDALARGEDTVTLHVPVQAGIVQALQRWLELVEAADRFCAQGLLLTLPASDEVVALRRWYVQAIEARLATSERGASAADR